MIILLVCVNVYGVELHLIYGNNHTNLLNVTVFFLTLMQNTCHGTKPVVSLRHCKINLLPAPSPSREVVY